MFCYSCGNQLPEEALFCNKCGKHLSLASTEPGNHPSGVRDASFFSEPTVAVGPSLQAAPAISQPAPPSATVPASPLSPGVTQRWLIRVFKPELAKNALFGSIMGSLVAFIPGLLLSLLVLGVMHAATPSSIHPINATTSEEGVDTTAGIVPLHSILRDGVQLFLVMHGAGEHIQYIDGTSANSTFTVNFSSPLNGLLIIPALLLILGGYFAASTDLWDHPRRSLLRGMAICLPYTCFLLIVLPYVNGNIPLNQAGGQLTSTLNVDVFSVITFGLLWGALFGLLGASFKLAHSQWRRYVRYYLRITPYAQFIGPVVGSLVAAGLGLALSFLLLCSAVAYTQTSVPLLQSNLCLPGDWQYLTFWSLAQGPLHAVNLFFFSLGAPVTIHTISPGNPCFYNALPPTFTIHSGVSLAPWFYLILLIPALSLFLGGRISASLARVRGGGPGAVMGAAIALPFTVLMMLLTPLSSITETFISSSTIPGSTSNTVTYSAGVGAFDVLLWALLFSAVLGALGGVYQTGIMSSSISHFLTRVCRPLTVMVKPLSSLAARFSGQVGPTAVTAARGMFYGAFLCALLLLLLSLLAGGSLIAFNQTLTNDTNQRIRDLFSVLPVALPGLFLVASCFFALCSEPPSDQSNVTANPGPLSQRTSMNEGK